MSGTIRHVEGPDCPLCQEKLEVAHKILQNAFIQIKIAFADCHVAWTFRNQLDQNLAFNEGRSRLQWPNSPHNKVPSLAMDLFRIRPDKVAEFRRDYYQKIADFCTKQGIEIFWGGRWEKFSDPPHFQVSIDQET